MPFIRSSSAIDAPPARRTPKTLWNRIAVLIIALMAIVALAHWRIAVAQVQVEPELAEGEFEELPWCRPIANFVDMTKLEKVFPFRSYSTASNFRRGLAFDRVGKMYGGLLDYDGTPNKTTIFFMVGDVVINGDQHSFALYIPEAGFLSRIKATHYLQFAPHGEKKEGDLGDGFTKLIFVDNTTTRIEELVITEARPELKIPHLQVSPSRFWTERVLATGRCK